MRSDDIAPLLGPDPGDPNAVRWGKGTVISWDTETGENVIRWRGADLNNVPIVASNSEVAQIQPGDEVGLNIIGSGGTATAYIIGRVVYPGTPGAASALGLTTRAAFVQADGSFVGPQVTPADLPGSFGPQLTVTVGASGRLLVIGSAKIDSSNGTLAQMFAQIGSNPVTFNHLMAASALIQSATNDLTIGSAGVREFSGLAPGPVTITAKYVAEFAGVGVSTFFGARSLVAIPL